MLNKGLHQYRFKTDIAERIFAEEWEKKNTSEYFSDSKPFLNGRGTLDYLLAEDNNDPRGEVSDRDREVAATVIQWLGSNVGMSFLNEVKEKLKKELKEEERVRRLSKEDKEIMDKLIKKGW